MTRARKTVAALIAAMILLGAAVAGIVVAWPHQPPGVPPDMVPASWAQFRTSAGHKAHVGQDKVTCKDCHDYEHEGFKNPGAAACTKCHDKEASHAHKGNDAKQTDCLTCHAFSPAKQMPKCISCHADTLGTHAAVKQHATTECTECHKMHQEPSIVPKDCESCHKQRAPEHAMHEGSKGCTDCHKAHSAGVAALETCNGCHQTPAGPKPAGHDSCLSCHKPHDFVAEGAKTCMGCHGVKPTLLATRVDKHASCTSCHTPHAPARAAASCQGCHAEVKVSHRGRDGCINCHQPHGGDVNAKARACTDCHQSIAATDTGAHRGDTACASCHKPHDFSPPSKLALCGSCHTQEKSLTAMNKGHADCTGCHGASAHQPAAAPTCGTCHTKEQATAPQGHEACQNCHEPHSGNRVPQAACPTCHADRAGGNHKAVKGGCETCHRPHGPGGVASPPACTTCHKRDELPGLHSVGRHDQCASCHTSHGPPMSDRQTCTGTCHSDRHEHQPQAQVCTGCHVFRKPGS